MNVIEQVVDILDLLYTHGWDERNGGNLSYIVSEEEVKEVTENLTSKNEFVYDFDMTDLIGKYFVITGSGKYFKNAKKDPTHNLGIVKVKDKNTLSLIYGLVDARPTSEAPTHLRAHIERLKKDPLHRLVIHTHTTNVIAMSHIVPLDSKKWTEILWKMQTESIVVFPEGIGVLPWMVCGGNEIGVATSELLSEYRVVVWAGHGIFGTGRDLDEVFGLLETVEKAAEIYVLVAHHKLNETITNENLIELAKAFGIEYKKGIID